jgi:hypothetical protein
MRLSFRPCLYLSALCVCLASCHKQNGSGAATLDSRLVGNWVYITSSFGAPDTAFTPGVQKVVSFYSDGQFILTYNDYFQSDTVDLVVVPYSTVLNNALEATGSWQTQTQQVPCAPSATFSALSLKVTGNPGLDYQYTINGDTLLVNRPPCLAPLTSIYIRSL